MKRSLVASVIVVGDSEPRRPCLGECNERAKQVRVVGRSCLDNATSFHLIHCVVRRAERTAERGRARGIDVRHFDSRSAAFDARMLRRAK